MAYPATPPEETCADRLVAQTVSIGGAVAAKGTNLFHGPESPPVGSLIPQNAVFIIATGGPAAQPYLGISQDYREVFVQVTVRDKTHSQGLATARACYAALHRASLSGYVSVLAQQAEPVYNGMSNLGHHVWTLNLACAFKG